jgi:hypothetical protein
MAMLMWDIDSFEQLQDAAWELDARANVHDANARRHGGESTGDADRATARAKRDEAARLLARYWVLPRPTPSPELVVVARHSVDTSTPLRTRAATIVAETQPRSAPPLSDGVADE